ncbi:MAG: amidohydrolase family protein, partial [Candidatus Binatus sp.]
MVVASGKADLVLHQGLVLGHPDSDSVAMSGGLIVAHGQFADLKPFVGPQTHLVKLAGRAVAPGFIDSHLHFREAAAAATGISVQRCRTVGDLLGDLRLAAGKTPPGNWLRAFGCDEALMLDKRGPTRAELDQSVPKNPVRLRHQTLHATWLNSRAIALLGLEAPDFTPPHGANMIRDAAGKLTGLVVGMETWLSNHLPPVTDAESESRARIMSREMAAAGVTAFTDATTRNGPVEMEQFARLAASGAICQRVGVMIGGQHLDDADRCEQLARAGGISLAGAKFMPGYQYDAAGLSRPVLRALERGLDCAFHVTEIEELDEAIDAIESAKSRFAGAHEMPRFRLEHGGLIPPNYIDRLMALGVWVVTNPGFIYFRGPKYAAEPGLVAHLYRARSLKDANVHLVGATDAPVTPARPLAAIAAAVSRTSIE